MELRDKVFNNFFRSNKLFLISIICYLLITIPLMLNHVPWYDEAHGWIVAQSMNFSNWQDIVRAEGHPLLWFILIMPFAKFNIAYPYPMLFINYAACLAAIIIMWKKAPFNNILKVTITFSSMFIIYFPIVARGYTLGVLILFILACLYKDCTKHPIIYALLISLAINLNIFTGIGASWFGLIFFTKLLRNDKLSLKIKVLSASILFFSVILFLFPYFSGYGKEASIEDSKIGFNHLFKFFIEPFYYYLIVFMLTFIFTLIKTKSKIEKTFILYTYSIMLFIFAYLYPGYAHHFIYFFVYLLVYLWISNSTSQDSQNIPCFTKKFDILTFLFVILLIFPLNLKMSYINSGNYFNAQRLVLTFNKSPEFRNSILYLGERESLLVPYLKSDIQAIDFCTKKRIKNWDTYNTRKCVNDWNFFDDNKNSYLFSNLRIGGVDYYTWGDYYIYIFPKRRILK